MRIEVTQAHIDKGTKGDPHNCAIAWALKELLDAKDVAVYQEQVLVDGKIYYLYGAGREFINKFDAANEPAPFEAVLNRKWPNETVEVSK